MQYAGTAAEICALLTQTGPDRRRDVAARVGRLLDASDTEADRRAAESLARHLAQDTIEAVRAELAQAVKASPFLPKDVAHCIARDIDAVAAPFLAVTEVFSEAELSELARTLSDTARTALASRPLVSAALAQVLAEDGDATTAETLARNSGAHIAPATATTLHERFYGHVRVLAALADRADLPLDIAARLFATVAEAARSRLARHCSAADFTEPLVTDAEITAMLKLLTEYPEDKLMSHVQILHQRGMLNATFLTLALRKRHLRIFEVAIAVLCQRPLEETRVALRTMGGAKTARLFELAELPKTLHEDYREAVRTAERGFA